MASPELAREAPTTRIMPLFRHFVEDAWKEAHCGRYKPSSRMSIRPVLAGQRLPAFGSKRLDRIGPARVRCWFYAFSRSAPGKVNQGLKPFREIMNFAVVLVRPVVCRSCPLHSASTYPPAVHEPRLSRANHCARMVVGIRQRTEH